MMQTDCKKEAIQTIKDVLSDRETEMLHVFITSLQAARAVTENPIVHPHQSQKKNEEGQGNNVVSGFTCTTE